MFSIKGNIWFWNNDERTQKSFPIKYILTTIAFKCEWTWEQQRGAMHPQSKHGPLQENGGN